MNLDELRRQCVQLHRLDELRDVVGRRGAKTPITTKTSTERDRTRSPRHVGVLRGVTLCVQPSFTPAPLRDYL